MKKLVNLLLIAGLVVATGGSASATLLFDRGLPSTNLNIAAGPDRSNVSWISGNPTGFTGDDFTIGTAGQSYRIDSLTVWGVQYQPLGSDIDNIWLYMGKAGGPLALMSTGSVTDNTNSNPNISHTFVSYPDASSTSVYEGGANPGDADFFIAQTTFSGLNFMVDGGMKYNFGVHGDKWLWWNHASNAALSGTPQDGADGKYLEFDTTNLSSVVEWDSNGNGWDKSSDINVQIDGAPVPEPGTIVLLGLGLAGIAGFRKKFKKQ